jgi:hypothetical protein
MRLACGFAILGLSFGLLALAAAQPPREKPDKPASRDDKANSPAVKRMVDRMMAFDKNKDGKLEKGEITDPRLMRVFERADANKDGVVTKEELTKLAARMNEENDERPGRSGPGDGPPGGPPDGPPGGPGAPPGGRGRFGSGAFAPPAPGQLLPPFLQGRLNLTAEQKKQLEELQKEIDRKLEKILTAEQKNQLKEMRRGFGPGGPGGPPGRGPGGPPRDDGDGPPPAR